MGYGLRHPADLVAWQRWHEHRHPARHLVRSARTRVRPPTDTYVDLLEPGDGADLLVAVETMHASVRQAVVAPLLHLDAARTAIVAPAGWHPPDAYSSHGRRRVALSGLTRSVHPTSVLAAGHYTAIGEAAFRTAQDYGSRFYVSQHGALTPFAPPLPPAAHLLAWTDVDGGFWTAGRADVTVTTTGSQLLWRAGATRDDQPGNRGPLTYLGQGHAAEIPRARLVHAALRTCRKHGAVYRPHPSEHDLTSRAALAAYARLGVSIAPADVPLVELTAPIVSIFSTGVLEAAARGREAWVDLPRPPAWLGEFWERYGMGRLGDRSTAAPERGSVEPARLIAEIVSA